MRLRSTEVFEIYGGITVSTMITMITVITMTTMTTSVTAIEITSLFA